jgi:hypothetical protein
VYTLAMRIPPTVASHQRASDGTGLETDDVGLVLGEQLHDPGQADAQ